MNILFVCSGNTCRSPLAKALLEKILEQYPGLKEEINVDSAGLYALEGEPASEFAIEAAKAYGASLEDHVSKEVNKDLVEWADLILVMESFHKEEIMDEFGCPGDKVHLLTEYVGVEGDIPDPYGGDIQKYMETAEKIYSLLNRLVEKIRGETKV